MYRLFSPIRRPEIEKTAADWIARHDRGLSSSEQAQFADWKAENPEHAAEFERLDSAWRSLDRAAETPELQEIARDIGAFEARRPWWRDVRFAGPATVGLAASIVVALTVFRTAPDSSWATAATPRYKVMPSSAQRLALVDGSIIQLNGESLAEPAFSATERRIRLVRGEAHFSVAKDPQRPFVVEVGEIEVRAVGTAFNIRLTPAEIDVVVTAGEVQVADPVQHRSLLASDDSSTNEREQTPRAIRNDETSQTVRLGPVMTAGQRVVLRAEGDMPVKPILLSSLDLSRVIAWQGTQLIFDRTPLEDAVTAFNSFNPCQVVLGDAALRVRKLGGTFRADNVDAFIRLLEAGFDITVERRSDLEIVLHPKR